MSYNIIAYVVYLFITVFIILRIGKLLHTNGRVFIVNLMHGNESFADTLNNILLTAYYIFNIGYALLIITLWEKIKTVDQLISSLSSSLGLLILILAVIHYFNMALVHYLSHKKNILHF